METCRTCAKCDFEHEANWLEDIFHPTRWTQEMANVRHEFDNWKLQICQNDGLPQKICTDCFRKFSMVHTFRLACQEAQLKLNNIFDKIEDDSQSLEAVEDYPASELSIKVKIKNYKNKDTLSNVHDIDNNDFRIHDVSTQTDALLMEVSNLTATTTTTTTTPAATTTGTGTATTKVINIKVPNYTAINFNVCSPVNNETPPTTTTRKTSNNTTMETITINEATSRNVVVEDQTAFEFLLNDSDNDIDNYADVNVDDINENDLIVTNKNNPEIIVTESTLITDDLFELVEETDEISVDIDKFENGNESTNAPPINTGIIFECKYCYKTKHTSKTNYFVTQSALLAHITSSHDHDYPFDCPQCNRRFQDAASRTVHMKDQHVEKLYTCEVCNKRYADKCNLRHHIEKYHSETDFECELCEKRFYSRKSLKYHMKWHTPDRQFKCAYCDRLFINQRHLKCHEATHTGIRSNEYCSFCGKTFIHLKTLRWHIYRQHGGEKPVKCSSCTEVFASYLDKRIHMLENHLENLTSNEKTECVRCHKQFENETDLKTHMIEHQETVNKPKLLIDNNKRVLQNKQQKRYTGLFQCELCVASFNMKSALERHAAVHSIVGRPHACPQCTKRFKRAQDMNWHMKTHSNEKPNVCDVCGKGFALKYVLTQHRRSHEVLEKNFTCATCGKSYLFEKSLKLHERQHTGKTYYKCDMCGENFVTHIKFKCHMRKVHDTNNKTNTKELPLTTL